MFKVLSKFKNRIQSMSKEPESVEVKPEAQVGTQPESQAEEKVKKVRKSREGITNQLQIILEVIERVRREGNARLKAIQIVSEKRGIARATVSDKCCRLLGLNAEIFDKMLNDPNLEELRGLLISRWPGHKDLINNQIQALSMLPQKETTQIPPERSGTSNDV
jgi:hypothetical protein